MNIEFKTDYDNYLVFTHNDNDGVFAGFIVKYLFDNNLENDAWDRNVEVICCDYDEKYNISFFKSKVLEFLEKQPNKEKLKIMMIDYCIQPNDEMIKFCNWLKSINLELIWIDHHETAIQNLLHYNIPGLQTSECCGAELTWKYLNKDAEIPQCLKMINDFDTWNESSEFSFDNQILPFSYFIQSLGTTLNDNTSNLVKILKEMFNDESSKIIENYTSTIGKAIMNFMNCKYDKLQNCVYEVIWNRYRCLILNSSYEGSFDIEKNDRSKDVDLLIKWKFDGDSYSYRIYTLKDDIDVGYICEKYLNGGGHKKCGGGKTKELIFKQQ